MKDIVGCNEHSDGGSGGDDYSVVDFEESELTGL